MTVKAKISFAIAFLLTIIVLIGASSHYYLEEIRERNAAIYGDDFQALASIESIENHLGDIAIKVDRDATVTQRDIDRLRSKVQILEPIMRQSKRLLNNEGSFDLMAELIIIEKQLQSVPVDSELSPEQAKDVLELVMEILDSLHTQFEIHEQAIGFAYDENQRTSEAASSRIALIGGVCVLLALLTLVWLPNSVTEPLRAFARSIDDLKQGDLSTRLEVKDKGEFGRLASSFNAMVESFEEQSNQSVAELLASRNQLRVLVNQLDNLILGIDQQRMIVFINSAMENYLGLSGEQALGKYMPDLALSKPRLQQLFEPIALGKSKAIEPIEIIDAKGEKRFYQERVSDLQGTGDIHNGYIITLSDVTDYEEKNNRQTDFLATLSHEMKTPIAAIKMSLNLLEDKRLGELDKDQRELTETIRSNNKRLLRMVNEVLRHSENESGDVRLSLEYISLSEVAHRSKENLRPLTLEKGLDISVLEEDELPAIEIDPSRIEWVVNNLLSNAIRYAPRGSEIFVDLVTVPGGIQLSVTDQGPGVPPQERDRIFEKYVRAANDTTKGTGLGLAISREYIEAHHGRIFVDADYDEGARFVLELPRVIPEDIREQQMFSES